MLLIFPKFKEIQTYLRSEGKDDVLDVADEERVNILVIGSRGFGIVKRALLGSFSDYCVHNASCPVIVYKTPEELRI